MTVPSTCQRNQPSTSPARPTSQAAGREPVHAVGRTSCPTSRAATKIDGEDGDRELDRAVNREHRRPRDEHRRGRPREHGGHGALPESPRDGPAGREHAGRAEGEAQIDDHLRVTCRAVSVRRPSSGSERPRARAPRRRATRSAAATIQSSSRRTRSAAFGPGASRTSEAGCAGSRRTWPAVGGATDVHDLGAGEEQHVPAGAPEARHPVDLFAEHEEVLVEQPDGVGGLAPDEQRGAREPVGLAGASWSKPPDVERVQDAFDRGASLRMKRYSVERRHNVGSARTRALQRAVRVQEPRPDDRGVGMRVGERRPASSSPSPITQASELSRKK